MRRRNREINIFSLSMLDVISGAMAAFLIIMVVLLPYYRKEHIDIDLHVIDPSGAEFDFQRKTVQGRPGELSEDTTDGPGTEVWEVRDAPPRGIPCLRAPLCRERQRQAGVHPWPRLPP